jgi:hypothetical protein
MASKRVAGALDLLVQGYSVEQVKEWLSKEKKIGKKEAERVFIAVGKELAALAAGPKSHASGFCLAASRSLYQKMLSVGDFGGALRAVQEIARLSQIYEEDTADADDLKGPLI